MNIQKWYPDEKLIHVYSGVAGCLPIWDEYVFPSPRQGAGPGQGNLSAGSLFDFSLVPIPGFVNFYILNETTTDGVADDRHETALWCGPAAKLFAGMVAKQDELNSRPIAFQFKMLSISAIRVIDILLSGHFGGFMDPFPRAIFWALPVLRPSTQPLTGVDAGQLIMKRRYVRREFAFLQSFTDVSWSAIAVTLLGVSLVASLLFEVRRRFVVSKRKHQHKTMWSRCFQRFINTLFLLSSLLLAESSGDVDWMDSLLLALWLLAATILSGCMNGSMRDLMSTAAQELVAETWNDVWREPFASMNLWAASYLPSWPTFRDAYPEQIDERLAAGKLHLCLSSVQEFFKEGLVEGELNWYIHMVTVGLDNTLLLGLKIIDYSILWGSILYERPLIDYIARTDELLLLPADEHRPVGELTSDERLSIAHGNYLDFWNDIYDLYYSPTTIQELLYLPVSSFAPTDLRKFFDALVEGFTEQGHADLSLSIVDLLEEHFFNLRPSKKAYEDLLLLDFYGPLMCYAVMIAAAVSALLIELWWYNRAKVERWWCDAIRKRLTLKRFIKSKSRVCPLADSKGSNQTDDFSLFTKSRSKVVIKQIVINR